MLIAILFILLIITGVYTYNTRQLLVNVASLIDQANANIDKAFMEDRWRIQKVEDKTDKLQQSHRRRGV